MQVIKRDESIQDYCFDKVRKVVTKAFVSINENVPEKFMEQLHETLENYADKHDVITVEQIQDIIQKELIKRNKYEVVEAFILYRNRRAEIRESKSDLIKQIQQKLNGTNIENQNANLDEMSFGGRIGEAGRIVCKNEALKMMSKKARKNHEDNIIYIHDLDSYASGMHNCLTEPLDDLLANGFTTRQTDVRPASSINTAMQLVAVCFQIQSLQQFGGVSASHIDHTMVPYVRKSFRKHYINSWIEDRSEFYDIDILGLTHTELNKWVTNMVTEFYLKTGLNKTQ
jgi:ribonucleoside-triphosphate reductase